jgi:hypothetical protein
MLKIKKYYFNILFTEHFLKRPVAFDGQQEVTVSVEVWLLAACFMQLAAYSCFVWLKSPMGSRREFINEKNRSINAFGN